MKRSTMFVTALAIFLTIADTVTKQLMLTTPNDLVPIIGNTLGIVLHRNGGVIANVPIPMPIILIATVVILMVLARWLYTAWKNGQTWIVNALIFLIFGALGNLVDRAVHGFTTDYILLFERSVINISDVLIFTGVAGLLVPRKK